MLQFLKTRWQLLVVLCLFIVIKAPALQYPFFLDESWSYAPGVKLMYLHGPSLMPNAIDLFYSRGHPMLFYAAAATWMKLFGTSHVAQHSFSLFISLLLLVAVYEVSLRLFGKKVALISLLLLPLQVMFFVQSTMLLPEIMIALLSLLTLFFYVRNKYLLTFLSCTALIFTKESGMVLGLILGVCGAIDLLSKSEPMATRMKRFLSVLSAGVLIGIFYLLQKQLNGWYLFPEHTGLISFNGNVIWPRIQYSLEVLFCHDYRIRLFQLLMLLGVTAAIRQKNFRYALPLIPAVFIYAIIEKRLHFIPHAILFLLMALSLGYTIYQLLSFSQVKDAAAKKFAWLGLLFFIGYLLFSGINFFTVRYLNCLLVVELILFAVLVVMYISKLHDILYYPVITLIGLIGTLGYLYDTGLTDVNLGAFDAMKVQEDVVTWFEKEQLYDKNIFASFTNIVHLQKPFTGFLHTGKTFTHVDFNITPATEYLIIDNIDSVKQFYDIRAGKDYHVVHLARKGQAWAEVYKK